MSKNKNETIASRKDNAYSNYYTIISFAVSLVYLLLSNTIDKVWSAIIAAILLVILFILCAVGIKLIRKRIESNTPKSKKMEKCLMKLSRNLGYLSFVALLVTLLIDNMQST